MADGFTIKVQSKQAQHKLRKIRDGLSPQKVDLALRRVSIRTIRRLIVATPKRYTGLTRQSWRIVPIRRGYMVYNPSKVMHFLEVGTRDHGPVRAKRLFIPLNARASKNGFLPGMKFGKDYVLAKRVKGIRAMRIVEKERAATIVDLRNEMQKTIRRLL